MKGLLLFLLLCAMGCTPTPESISIPLEGKEGAANAAFYLGLLTSDHRQVLVIEDTEGVRLDFITLKAVAPTFADLLEKINTTPRDELSQNEWLEFINTIVRETTPLPGNMKDLFPDGLPYDRQQDYFVLRVRGAMTSLERRIFVPSQALENALLSYFDNNQQLIYPTATVILAQHVGEDQRTVEYTAKKRRADGYWNFAVYDSTLTLTDRTISPPNSFDAPHQCVGCHLGTRLFQPEKSFPGVPPRSSGMEQLMVEPSLRNPAVAEFLREHEKRSDHVLGLYATVYLARILQMKEAERTRTQDEIYAVFKERLSGLPSR